MTVECLDNRYSTTRRLARIAPSAAQSKVRENIGTRLSLQAGPKRVAEGGLRSRGFFKADATDSKSRPLISVITVVFNGVNHLERTILSVLDQTYDNVEYIVVDGGSTDGTLEIIRKYSDAIDYWVSEPDAGIYDAMNRGVTLASAPWLHFLNAGDLYFASDTLEKTAGSYLDGVFDFIYSDAIYVTKKGSGTREVLFKGDHNIPDINHQAAIYKKALHDSHGFYLVARGVTISDYLFFSLIKKQAFCKTDHVIAIYDATGVSSSRRGIEQKFIVDYLLNGMPKLKFVAYFLFYGWYRDIFK